MKDGELHILSEDDIRRIVTARYGSGLITPAYLTLFVAALRQANLLLVQATASDYAVLAMPTANRYNGYILTRNNRP